MWTSAGQIADLGMLMARTDPTVPKHSGISYFAIDMHQPGIEVRPLKEMTGRALFNEVFISDARVADEALIGGERRGWAVANTTLMFERAGLGAGGTGAVSSAVPGTVHGHLEKRVGDFVRGDTSGSGSAMAGGGPSAILKMAATTGAALHDPVLRDDLMRLHTLVELAKMTNRRAKAAKAIGIEIPGLPNLSKLMMSDMMRATIDLGPRILGPRRPVGRRLGPLRRRHHRDGAVRPRPGHLRRHRPDPAQHHRRAGARPAVGASQRQDPALQRAAHLQGRRVKPTDRRARPSRPTEHDADP
ncbi:MAG: hypothetical protein V9F00_00020 [Nocardioides sp.]